jgi:hypothetical protein
MTQLDLTLPPAHSPRDPSTSAKAAAEYTASGARPRAVDRVAELVRQWPGCTSAELAARSGMDRHEVAKRLPDAEAMGLVSKVRDPEFPYKPQARRCSVSGRLAVCWVVA